FTDYQLDSHTHAFYLQNEIASLRHQLWRSENRLRRLMGNCSQDNKSTDCVSVQPENPVQIWLEIGGLLAVESPVPAQTWMGRLGSVLARATNEVEVPPLTSRSPVWQLQPTNSGSIRMWPSTKPLLRGQFHSVVFPVPKERVSFSVLWHWRKMGAHKLWFFEAGDWRGTDVEAVIARKVYRKLGRTFLGRWVNRCLPNPALTEW